jgi:acyl-CoA reductase-like NAD-dependent aldehyde dehydrogenase
LICGAEHNLVVDARVVDACLDAMIEEGAAVLTPAEAEIFLQNSIDLKTGGFKEELVGKDAATIAAAYGIERPYPIRLIIVATDDSSANNPLACEKLLPVLSLFTYESLDSAIGLCQQLLSNDGRGHTAVIHTQDEQVMRRFAIAMPASRILVNSPSAHGTIGVCTPLLPSLTLGCGTFGGTSTTDNVTYTHLMNIKRVARFVPEKLAQLVQA